VYARPTHSHPLRLVCDTAALRKIRTRTCHSLCGFSAFLRPSSASPRGVGMARCAVPVAERSVRRRMMMAGSAHCSGVPSRTSQRDVLPFLPNTTGPGTG